MTDDLDLRTEARARYLNGEPISKIAVTLHKAKGTVSQWLDGLKRKRGGRKKGSLNIEHKTARCRKTAEDKLIAADEAHLEDLQRGHARMWDGKDWVNVG
jgi:hypothetical protein